MTKKHKIIAGVAAVIFLAFATYFVLPNSIPVRTSRTFNAPVGKVWELWKDADTIKKWWGPKGFEAPTVESDFKENGIYLYGMKGSDENVIWNTGRYVQIIPNKKIYMQMSFSDEQRNILPASHYGLPGNWPDEVYISLEFSESEGKTTVSLTELGIPLVMYIPARWGWSQQFDKMEKLLLQ